MRLMIIGQLGGVGTSASQIALEKGANVILCSSIEEALSTLRLGKTCDLALIDVELNVKSFISSLIEERFSLEVIGCGITHNPKKAAQAIRDGAKEYISLPPDPEMIAALIETTTKVESAVIVEDIFMKKVFALADKIAPSEANVLLTGESGTGKEVMARYIHNHSKRSDKSFISINCAAIPENLLESELFGHEKGAFTGAQARRIGKFEEADHGTLLLDEITEMHPRLQAKLLRAIQEKVIDRVGGTAPVKINIRIIATSNRNMLEATQKGDFREDLYYRLNVVNLELPSLKNRPKDILPLARFFLEKYAKLNEIPLKELDPLACDALLNHPFKGNVRELENLMHRAILLADDVIYPSDIFSSDYKKTLTAPVTPNSLIVGRTVESVEQELIVNTLTHCLGNKNTAAHILGISIRTLRNKLKEYEEKGIISEDIAIG
ncbi:MAG: sigma-54-dependent Fis family transcriptional regulator [Proteobacteria bacterium]|nr:sigma-54-dependent Fis family transcriptional regulator [Pseudomonadota bacterium]